MELAHDLGSPREAGAPILLLSEHFHPTTGGSVRWFDNLLRRYRDGPVNVLARSAPGDARADASLPFRVERVPFRSVPWLRPESALNYLRLWARASRIARGEGIAVTVAARAVPEGVIALSLRRRWGIPYVVFAQGEEITVPVWERRRFLTRNAKILAMRRVYERADRVLVNSEYTAGLVRAFGLDAPNLVVLHPGVDLEWFRPDGANLRKELGLEGRRVLLTVGALMDRKGQAAVVAAMPEILRRVPDAAYLIAGSGSGESALRETARVRGVESAVRLLGKFPEERLPALYRTADVFVLANRRPPDGDIEGFGIVFLEASASGLPVIAGEPGGNREALEEGRTALRVDPEDPASVAAAASRLLGDPELARSMGARGRAFVRERFAWDPLAERWSGILREVRAEAAAVPHEISVPDSCAVCGARLRGPPRHLFGRPLLRCAECGFVRVGGDPSGREAAQPSAGATHVGRDLPRSPDPAGLLRSLRARLSPGEAIEVSGLPNFLALRVGLLRRSECAGVRNLFSPSSLAETLRRAGLVGVDVRTAGADGRRCFRRWIPSRDAREALGEYLKGDRGGALGPGRSPGGPASRGLLARVADACGVGTFLSARARRP